MRTGTQLPDAPIDLVGHAFVGILAMAAMDALALGRRGFLGHGHHKRPEDAGNLSRESNNPANWMRDGLITTDSQVGNDLVEGSDHQTLW